MMKKMLFLMLFLLILGAVNVSSQVRIGGNEKPNAAAVLDLNADNDTNTGTKGLALPRVSLSDKTAKLDGVTANIKGMLVYNTGGSLAEGVYYWNGETWVNTLGSYILGGDSLIAVDSAHVGDVLRYDSTGWRPVPGIELVSERVVCTGCNTYISAGTRYRMAFAFPARTTPRDCWITPEAHGGWLALAFEAGAITWGYTFSIGQTSAAPTANLTCLRTTR